MTKRRPDRAPRLSWLDRGWERLLSSTWYARVRAVAHTIWSAPLWKTLSVMTVVLSAVIVFGATRSSNGRVSTPEITATTTPSQTPTPQASPSPEPSAAGPGLEALQTQIGRIESRYNVQIGVAVSGISPVGSQLTATWSAGSVSTAPAWGTIDLPIALAANRLASAPPNFTYMLTKSISESSLSSDEALYSFLGDANTAAGKTTDLLRSFGDQTTTVTTTTGRQGVPAFSQTGWPVASQAQFASQLWCSSTDAFILSRMRFVDDEHSYGFGRTISSLVKTSEGTDDTDRPVLRQVAIVPDAQADRVGVGLVVIGQKNDLSSARLAADAVASQVYFGATGADGGHC